MEQQNWQQECSSFIVLELWQNIEFSGNPENKCAEYEVVYIFKWPRLMSAWGKSGQNDKSILKPQVDGESGPPLDTYTRGATFSLIAIILASAAVLAGSYIGGE